MTILHTRPGETTLKVFGSSNFTVSTVGRKHCEMCSLNRENDNSLFVSRGFQNDRQKFDPIQRS
jgi:hypothetical protein